jgi:septum formation protein
MRLILASASPRRAELLTSAGFSFEIAPASIDETPYDNEPPADYVLRVARDKAAAAGSTSDFRCRVLGADTAVVIDRRLLGKPADDRDAAEMLRLLSGRVHEVHTGVVLLAGGHQLAEVVTTRVRFVPLTDAEIHWYVATGEPNGKAGAYAIQGRASRFVDSIEGSWSNVVGLPISTVYALLKRAARDILT